MRQGFEHQPEALFALAQPGLGLLPLVDVAKRDDEPALAQLAQLRCHHAEDGSQRRADRTMNTTQERGRVVGLEHQEDRQHDPATRREARGLDQHLSEAGDGGQAQRVTSRLSGGSEVVPESDHRRCDAIVG